MTTKKTKVLYVVHNHPKVRPGGAEAYALELYQAMGDMADIEPVLLARTGPPLSAGDRYHEGTLTTTVDGHDPNQYFFYTDFSSFDWMLGTPAAKAVIARYLRDFVAALQPDVVHFQHTLFIGYEAIREVHNVAPDAAIVYTLHEFLPICHRQGQLLRTTTDSPCEEESPRRCHECYPHIAPQEFFMRKRFIQSHLKLVDVFLAPSMFLRDRYVDWGIDPNRIRHEDYGRLPITAKAPSAPEPRSEPDEPRRLAFFGQLSKYKGVNVLLQAAKKLAITGLDFEVAIHGANLDVQPEEFRHEFESLLTATRKRVTFHGEYDRDELPALMARADWIVVPSIWWENSPLVIQEAFMYGKPVICSDIGGMAEKVSDGVDGLHFRAGDSESLAATIARAVDTPGLWDELRRGIRTIHPMAEHIEVLRSLYAELLARPEGSAAAGQIEHAQAV